MRCPGVLHHSSPSGSDHAYPKGRDDGWGLRGQGSVRSTSLPVYTPSLPFSVGRESVERQTNYRKSGVRVRRRVVPGGRITVLRGVRPRFHAKIGGKRVHPLLITLFLFIPSVLGTLLKFLRDGCRRIVIIYRRLKTFKCERVKNGRHLGVGS